MAGTVTANTIQLGDSGTATQNFHLTTNNDGSVSLNRGNRGSSLGSVLTINSSGQLIASIPPIGISSAQMVTLNTTSGTAIDVTGIPSWAIRVTVMLNGVSASGTSIPLIQIGSGSVQTSGYAGLSGYSFGAGTTVTSTSGVLVSDTSNAADFLYGLVTIVKLPSNQYLISGSFSQVGQNKITAANYSLTLAPLDRIRLTTANGTDTFDAGSITVIWE